VRRAVTGWQAAILPLAGTLIAVPLGVAAAAAMRLAATTDEGGRLTVPWLVVAALIVGIPLVSGLGARAVAAVAVGRRAQPMAALALD
jgi:hypothetical protein